MKIGDSKKFTPAQKASVKGARSKGSSNWHLLTDEQLAEKHEQVKDNAFFIGCFNAGVDPDGKPVDDVQFYVVDDVPGSKVVTRSWVRGEMVTFKKDGEVRTVPVEKFSKRGTGKKAEYKIGDKTIQFYVANVSLDTEFGTRSLDVVTPVSK